MRGMRDDYLTPYIHLSTFTVSASIVVESGNLQFLVCELHKNGLPLSYVHAPLHPLTGYLPSIHADRMASIQPCVRTVRSAKASYNSTAFRLHNAIGSSHGLSVTSIGCQRSWNLKHAESVHYASEVVAFRNREDVQALMRSFVARCRGTESQYKCPSKKYRSARRRRIRWQCLPVGKKCAIRTRVSPAQPLSSLPESVNARKALQDPVNPAAAQQCMPISNDAKSSICRYLRS